MASYQSAYIWSDVITGQRDAELNPVYHRRNDRARFSLCDSHLSSRLSLSLTLCQLSIDVIVDKDDFVVPAEASTATPSTCPPTGKAVIAKLTTRPLFYGYAAQWLREESPVVGGVLSVIFIGFRFGTTHAEDDKNGR